MLSPFRQKLNDNSQLWAISAFYFFYFSILGALVPYWGLYLKDQGYNALQIGELIAIISLTKIVSPMLWSWMSDRLGQTMRIVRYSSFISLIFFAFVFVSNSYWSMAWTILAFSFFWNATLPQFEANTVDYLGTDNVKQYSRMRIWGSLGFILMVSLIGYLSDQFSIQLLPIFIVILFALLWLVSLKVNDAKVLKKVQSSKGFWAIVKQKQVLIIMAIILLIQISHGVYYSFFSIYLAEHGYNDTVIGLLWGFAVMCEVFVFLVLHKFVDKIGMHALLGISLVLTSIRWVLIAFFIDYTYVVLIAQSLHAASFGVFHVLVVYIISAYFSPNHKSLGQALYISVGFGVGGALGSYLAGLKWDSWGGETVFLVFSLFSIASVWLFYQFADYKKI